MASGATVTVRWHPEVVTGPVKLAFDIAADRAVAVARAAAPYLTGELQRSIRWLGHGYAGTLVATAKHAAAHEFGSGPHLITPRLGGALYNPYDSHGQEFGPVGYANHPGTPKVGFLAKAAEAFPGLFALAFKRLL